MASDPATSPGGSGTYRVMKRLIGPVLLFGLACGGESARPLAAPKGAPVRDTLIVPGERVGPIALGMSSSALLETMGPPDESVRFSDGVGATFKSAGLYANVLDTTQQVFAIHVNDERYATKEGLKLGSSEMEVRAKLGAPTRHVLQSDDGVHPYENRLCYETGITFYMNTAGRVYVLQVHPRRETEGPQSHC